MSTTSNTPSQQQVNDAAQRIQQAGSRQPAAQTPEQTQARNDQQTRDAADAREQQRRQQEQTRQQSIRDAASRQRETVRARQEEVRHGDMVVVDLERVPQAMHTVAMRDRLQQLHQGGAHQMVGRVQRIEDGPSGRQAVVEDVNGTRVLPVPMAAIVRADLYDQPEQD